MRISDWSSDVCSSDLFGAPRFEQADREVRRRAAEQVGQHHDAAALIDLANRVGDFLAAHFHIVVGADAHRPDGALRDRKSVVSVKSVSVRVDIGGRSIIKKKTPHKNPTQYSI